MNPLDWIKARKNNMIKEIILGFVRHSLTTLGGVAVTKGFTSSSDVDIAIGAVMTLVGILWSAVQKIQTTPLQLTTIQQGSSAPKDSRR